MTLSRSIVSMLALATLATAAHADFASGNLVSINGAAGPEFGGTTWGTQDGQGTHALGGSSLYWDSVFGNPVQLTIGVTSVVNNASSVTFTFDFSQFQPADFSVLTISIVGLKQDGTLELATASIGQASTDGNTVQWSGSGTEMSENGPLSLTVRQVPAPGALALLGAAGLALGRRRRN